MKMCEYNCGQKSKYQLKNGKWCCEISSKKCPEIIRKSSESRKGLKRSERQKRNISRSHIGQKSAKKNLTYEEIYGTRKAKLIKQKMRNSKLLTRDIEKIKSKFSFLYLVENFKVDTDKIVKVKCKNSSCNRWFEPSYTQIYERHRALSNPSGFEENNFYCSDECKNKCILYGSSSTSLLVDSNYINFVKYVLKRDNYECQICGEQAEHVHHERSKKLEPFFAYDPDLAWALCKKCHYEKYHKKGTSCSTGYLARVICS